jgi:hypothetical protein
LDESGDDFAALFHACGTGFALRLELPLVSGEALGGFFDPAAVFLINEVGAVTATSLNEFGRGASQDTLAAVAKDARPVAFKKRDVKHPRSFALGVFETHPLVGVTWNSGHEENLVGVTPSLGHL